MGADLDDAVVGVGQLSTLIMMGSRLHMDFVTYGRVKLWIDIRPTVAYLDGTSAILERFGGKEVHHFLLGIEASKTSRKLKLEQWVNEAALARKAGHDAAHSYGENNQPSFLLFLWLSTPTILMYAGKPPPGFTIMETLLSDGYHDSNYLKVSLDNFVNNLLRVSIDCDSSSDLRRCGILPFVMMLDCDLAEGKAVLLSFNGMDIVEFSIVMRSTVNPQPETLEQYLARLVFLDVHLCIPAWCFRHNVKNFYEYPLHCTTLKTCTEDGYETIAFSAGRGDAPIGDALEIEPEDGAVGQGPVVPPTRLKERQHGKRGRLSQLSSVWCCTFTNSRSETWLMAASDVAAAVLNSRLVPPECISDCCRAEVAMEVKSYFDGTRVALKQLARSTTPAVTFNDVITHLKHIPTGEQHSTLLQTWVKAFRVIDEPSVYVICCGLGSLQATIKVHATGQGLPMPWYEPQVWRYWCDFKFKYYLLWTHILPILAHLLRHGSQTIEVANKLLKKTIRDVVRVSKKRGMGIKLSEYVAVRLPIFLAEQLQYVDREREGATWAHKFGLAVPPAELATLVQSVGGAPSKRKVFDASDFGPRNSIRMEEEVRNVGPLQPLG